MGGTTAWREEVLVLGTGQAFLRRAGDPAGPGVLVLHDAGADTVDASAWADLAGDHDVVQLLLPGYGGSTPPPAGIGVGWVTDHLATALDALSWGRVCVVGTSLGGWFAIELGLAHPDRVASLVLCDPAGLQTPQDFLLALFADGRAAAGSEAVVEQTVLAHLADDQRDVDARPPVLGRAMIAPYVADMAAAALSSWNPWVPDARMMARLPQLAAPTSLLWGARDALIPLAHGRAMVQAIPSARLQVVEGAGHLLPLEHPATVAAAVRDAGRPPPPGLSGSGAPTSTT